MRKKGTGDVESIKVKVVLRSEGKEEVDGFGVSRRGEAVAEGVAPLFVTKGDQAGFVLCRVAQGVHFDLEIDFGGEDLVASACRRIDGNLRAKDGRVAMFVTKGCQFLVDSLVPFGPVRVFASSA